jgi:hypothetical protein
MSLALIHFPQPKLPCSTVSLPVSQIDNSDFPILPPVFQAGRQRRLSHSAEFASPKLKFVPEESSEYRTNTPTEVPKDRIPSQETTEKQRFPS